MNLYTIKQVNEMDDSLFVEVFGVIYEHSEWIASEALKSRPFANLNDMLDCFRVILDQSNDAVKLALLRAHPELAGKEAEHGQLTNESLNEQSSAGLNSLEAEQLSELKRFNALYMDMFKFPFIIAVKNHSKDEIFKQMALRIKNCVEDEFEEALKQVDNIAKIRIHNLVQSH